MATTPTNHYGFGKPTVGASTDTWGTENNAAWDDVDDALYAVDLKAQYAAPPGAVMDFFRTSAPTGWLVLNGTTIGDASSGAAYANADASALFAILWGFSNSICPILNSDGTAGTRGANAAADFAAHKRLTLIDQQDRFRRSFKSGGASAAIGVLQSGEVGPHTHTTNQNASASGRGDSAQLNHFPGFGSPNGTASVNANGGSETRPVNIAYLTCIKV